MASVRKREWTHNGETKTAWVVAYTDGGGKRRLKTFEKKKDADAWRLKTENEIVFGDHVAPSQSPFFPGAAKEWLQFMSDRHRDGRGIGTAYLRQIQYTMADFIELIGNVRLVEFNFAHVESATSKMRARGMKAITIKVRLQKLSAFIGFCMRRKYLSKNPVADYIKEMGAVPYAKVRTFTEDEFKRLLEAVDARAEKQVFKTHAMLRCFVHIAGFCGLRIGEIGGLTKDSLDIANRVIKVRHSLTVLNELKLPKTKAGIRDVPMPAHVAGLLEHWMKYYYLDNPRKLVFLNRNDEQFSQTAFVSIWHKLLRRAGLNQDPKLGFHHFHALRHFAASGYIRMGIPLPDVATLLGHHHFDMTLQVYAHDLMVPAARADSINRLAESLLVDRPEVWRTRQESDKSPQLVDN